MASKVNKLFSCSKAWGTDELRPPCKDIKNTCRKPEGICALNANDFSRLNRDIFRAAYSYINAFRELKIEEVDGYLYGDIAVIAIGPFQYAAERALADGTHEIALYNASNGELRMAKISTTGRYSTFKIGAKTEDFDVSTAILCLIAALCHIDAPFKERIETVRAFEPHDFFFLCDSIYQYVNYSGGQLNVNIPDDLNIPLISRQKVEKGIYKGTTIVGNPVIFAGDSGVLSSSTTGKTHLTMKEAKKEFKNFANSRKWTEDEKSLIPSFPDDFPIPPEALKIARRYINTKKDIRPQVNFMWRGITSYGKSTGVECIACMLNVPLVRMTCHTNMETQQFLSDFVPDTAIVSSGSKLPDFDSMRYDPVGTYEELTGIHDESATHDMCLKAFGEAFAKSLSSTPRFKHVESNFVKGLSRGYIVEVQECSRIKDSGVLVGLNEYDRPGSVIPLIDGTYSKRDENAMVIYTDNVGYASCRAMDPSVIRRMAFIIDSYEMPKADVLARVKYNTKVEDTTILESCYKIWEQIKEFAKEHDIEEGDISVTELEMLVQAIKYDGMGLLRENVRECIISKATSDIDEQEELLSFYDTMPSVSI